MADGTGISWTDATWNPIRGCRRTAPAGSKQSGCGDPTGGGYAERQAARFCGPGGAYEGLITLTANGPRWSGETRFVSDHLLDPLRWRKPRRIFTDSMSDLFYQGVETWMIDRIVAVMMICCLHDTRGGHVFQTLTKRADRLLAYFTDPAAQERVARAAGALMEDGDGWFDAIAFRKEGLVHPNMWWGVSVENQAAADERIPELLKTPAAIRFLSCEPLLGPVTLDGGAVTARGVSDRWLHKLDWVIAGCESGHGARPCNVAWLRSLIAQCRAAGVPPFLKQAVEDLGDADVRCDRNGDARGCGERIRYFVYGPGDLSVSCGCCAEGAEDANGTIPIGVGDGSRRKAGGVIELPYLDGVQHAAFPEVARG